MEPNTRLRGVSACVEVHFLGEGVGEGAEGCFCGAVGRIAGKRVKGNEGGGEDEVTHWWLILVGNW